MADVEFTPGLQEVFLEFLRQVPVIRVACDVVGVTRDQVSYRRANDDDFAAAMESAIEDGYDTLEEEAIRRARDGVNEPVFYKGEVVGEVRKYSDTLMTTLLRGYRRKTFATQNVDVTSEGKKVDMVFNLGGKNQEARDDNS